MPDIPGVFAKTDQNQKTDSLSSTLDNSWLKSSFVLKDSDAINGGDYGDFVRKNRYSSSADLKFTSTSPGMNIAVNPKPQFTRYCDIRRPGKISDRPGGSKGIPMTVSTTSHPNGLGMGPYYSEAIDDNQQRIFMRFGVPRYTPLLLWIAKSFDIDKTVLHNRGVITSTLLVGIGLVSKFFAIAAAPLLGLGMFALNVIVQSSRYYSVNPTMYNYWAVTENILNALVARRTMVPQVLQDFSYRLDNPTGKEQKVTSTFIKTLSKYIPDIVNEETGRISVFAIALRSQVAFNKMLRDDMIANEKTTLATDYTGYQLTGNKSHDTYFTNNAGKVSLFVEVFFKRAYDYLIKDNVDEKIDGEASGQVSLEGNAKGATSQTSLVSMDPLYTDKYGNPLTLNPDPNNPDSSTTKVISDNAIAKKTTFEKYQKYMLAELTDGGAFAVFNVDSTGSVGESFSNSTTSNPMESTFNAVSSKVRNYTNILSSATDIPVVSEALKLAADAGAMFASKATFGLVNPLLALAYGVNVSMPKVWENSSASLPRASYKMKLISPYGNSYSQLFNIYLPLSMMLAGSLPRSTGMSSHTSPFLCQVFDRGRINTQLGIIDSVSITRGTSNLAFSRNGHPNAIDIDFSIANLDEIVSVDVNSNGVVAKLMDAFSPDFSDTPFTTYMNTIAAVDVYTQIYRVPMLRLKLAERTMAIKSIINPDPAAFAAFTVNKMPLEGLAKTLLGSNQAALQDIIGR